MSNNKQRCNWRALVTAGGTLAILASALSIPMGAGMASAEGRPAQACRTEHHSQCGVVAMGESTQTAPIGTAFISPLSVRVTRQGRPVSGVRVRYAAPSMGPSAVLSQSSVITDAQGVAAVTATATSVAGRYKVIASVRGAARRAVFSLENVDLGGRGATFTQELQQNSLVAGKTSALRLFVGPDTITSMSKVEAEISRPDGSLDSASWLSSDVAATGGGTAEPSIVVRVPGRLIPLTGQYSLTARILDARGVVLANYALHDIQILPTRDLKLLVVFLVHPGYFDATQAWYDDIRASMDRIGAIFPVRDGVREGFDNPQSAGLEYVIGTPCDGWSTTYYDCVYGQTRQLNAQPGHEIDVTVEYRPGFYAPEYDPPGDPNPGGNAGPPPAPYSDLHRANCVAGVWNGTQVTAPACAHEIGHNFGLEAACSPHWDGGLHSKDYAVDDAFAFDALKNVPYPSPVGDIMSGGWSRGADGATLNAFDWEYMRKVMLGMSGC